MIRGITITGERTHGGEELSVKVHCQRKGRPLITRLIRVNREYERDQFAAGLDQAGPGSGPVLAPVRLQCAQEPGPHRVNILTLVLGRDSKTL